MTTTKSINVHTKSEFSDSVDVKNVQIHMNICCKNYWWKL